jgi:dTDP-4-dehydrorhamnose reductase
MRILVFGADGQLGRAIKHHIDTSPIKHEMLYANRNRCDIGSLREVELVVNSFSPDVIINAAAYTNVEKAETDQAECYNINHVAVMTIGLVAKKFGVKLVHISTDYVFDGTSNRQYTINDRVRPLNIYGHSKLLGERALSDLINNQDITSPSKYVIVRTSWVVSRYSQNFITKMRARMLSGQKAITVVDDQVGRLTLADDLAVVCVDLAERLYAKEIVPSIIHYAGRKVASWYDITVALAKEVGYSGTVSPTKSNMTQTAAVRPLNSVLQVALHYEHLGSHNIIKSINDWLVENENPGNIGSTPPP